MGRYNRRYGRGRPTRMSFSVLIMIVLFAVATGYVATKYIVYPYVLNGQAQQQPKDGTAQGKKNGNDSGGNVNTITSLPSVVMDGQDIKNETDSKNEKKMEEKSTENSASKLGENGTNIQTSQSTSDGQNTTGGGAFSLQFGSFSEKDRASQRVKELNDKGINAYVFENGGSYRVLGNMYDTKDKAKQAADIVSQSAVDVFVVDMKTIL